MKKIFFFLLLIFFQNHKFFSQSGAALNFDGVNDYVNLNNANSIFNISSAHLKTVQLWYKSTANQGAHVRIFSTGSAGWTSGMWIGFASGSSFLMVEISDGVSTGVVATSTTATRGDNTWHHASTVFNGSVALLYLDGVLQSTVNISGEGTLNSSGAVHIGNSYNNESGSNFQGNVDELRIWNRPLCQYDIQATKDCELNGNEYGLLSYYKFNQGTASGNNTSVNTCTDVLTSTFTGTLNNFALTGSTSNWVAPGGVVSGVTCTFTPQTVLLPNATNTSICVGSSITLNISGVSSCTWLPINSTATSIVISPTINSTYSVQAIDANGCLSFGTKSIVVNPTPTLIISSPLSPWCSNIPASISVAGANNYTWLPTNVTGSLITITPTASFIYTVVGLDQNGCGSSSTVGLSVSSPTLVVNTSTNQLCLNQSATLSATGANSYTWLPGNFTTAILVVTPTISASYTLIGADNNGCTANSVSIINVITMPTLSVSNSSSNICSGNSTTLSVTGASSYTWNTSSNSSSIVVNPASNTVYSVTGANGGCAANATVAVFVTPTPTISISSSQGTNVCTASSTTLTASGSGCSYTWMPSGLNNFSINLVPSTSVVYSVFANCNGCLGTKTIGLNVSPPPSLNISASNYSLCSGNSATLTGTGATSYTWNTGSNSSSISVSPGSTSGYTLFGNNGGCTGYTITTINVNPSVNLSVFNQTVCTGGSATLQASGANNYTWNTGANTSSIIISPTANAIYTVMGNIGFCSDTKTLSVSLGTFFTIPILGPNIICVGSSATLLASSANNYTWSTNSNNASIIISPSVSTVYTVIGFNGTCNGIGTKTVLISSNPTVAITNGTAITICSGATVALNANGGATYTWSNGGLGNQILVTPTSNTIYNIIGSNSVGCTNTAAINVSLGGTAIAVSISASNSFVCSGTNVTLTANGASNYTWSNGATSSAIVVSPTINSSYSINASNGGCNGTATQSLFILNANPIAVTILPSATVCLGNTINLSASGNFTSVYWINSTTNSISITPTASSNYTVVGNASGGSCSNQSVVSIIVNNNPVSTLSVTNGSCGKLCDAKLSMTSLGGASPFTYSLTGSTCTTLPCNNLCAGLYTVYTTDNNGCKSFNIFSITNLANNLLANITATHATCVNCANGLLVINMSGGSNPYTYTWTPVTGSTSTLNNLLPGCYTVDITDGGGCTTKSWACIGIATGLNNSIIYLNDLSVFPNPVSNLLNVVLDGFEFDVSIYNSLGQILSNENKIKNSTKIDLQNFSKGIYFAEITVGQVTMRAKIIKD